MVREDTDAFGRDTVFSVAWVTTGLGPGNGKLGSFLSQGFSQGWHVGWGFIGATDRCFISDLVVLTLF